MLVLCTPGVGAIALVLLLRIANADHVLQVLDSGEQSRRPATSTPASRYSCSAPLLGIALAARRELPVVLRGLLIAVSAGCLQLYILGQSRGWLSTLPAVIVVVFALMPDRLRLCAAAAIPSP